MLAGIVWKFFERVEAVLKDDTKLEIAVWLIGLRTVDRVPWPETFAKVFDRVFGDHHLSWLCFGRSCIASWFSVLLVMIWTGTGLSFVSSLLDIYHLLVWWLLCSLVNMLPDYVSLLKTRLVLHWMIKSHSLLSQCVLVCLDLYFTSIIASCTVLTVLVLWNRNIGDVLLDILFLRTVREMVFADFRFAVVVPALWFFPAFFTSIWLLLYAGCGLLLKAAHRFDIAVDWINRRMDEKKALSTIGLVAGCLVALIYWTAAIIRHFV